MKMDLELVVNHYGPDGLVGDRLPLLDYGVIFCHKHPDGSFHYGASDTLQNAQSEKVIKFVSDYLDSNGKSSLVELKCRSYDQKSQKSSYKAKLYSGLPGEGIELVDQLIGCNIGGEHKELKDLLSKHQPRLISSGINKGLEGHHAEIHESFCEEIWAIASPYRVDPPFRYLK